MGSRRPPAAAAQTTGTYPRRTGTTTLRAALRAVLGRGPVRTESLPIEDPHLPNNFQRSGGSKLPPRQRGARQGRRGFSSASDHTGLATPAAVRRARRDVGSTPRYRAGQSPLPGGSTRVEGSRYPAATHARGGLPAYVASNSLASTKEHAVIPVDQLVTQGLVRFCNCGGADALDQH